MADRNPWTTAEASAIWNSQYQRARRLKGELVEYRPPYNAETLGMPTERIVGVVLETAAHDPQWGPIVRLGFGPLEKKPGASFATYRETRLVPIATCRALRQVEEVRAHV